MTALISSLPMYDRPEIRAETDRLWALTRDALRDEGIAAPEALTRDWTTMWAQWQSPDLLLSQTCGLPLRARLHDKVQLVATPDFGLPGCPPGYYSSVIVTRPEMSDWPLDRLLAARVVANDGLSQSGWGALVSFASEHGVTLGRPLLSGGHAASARAVLEGRADVAALDAQTWRLLLRYEPEFAALAERTRTRPTPSLPMITAKGRDPEPILRTLNAALDALTEPERTALGLTGFARIPLEDYMAFKIPPNPDDLP